MSKQIIAAVTTLALGILGLAPAAQAASHVAVSVNQFGVQVNGDASDNSIQLAIWSTLNAQEARPAERSTWGMR